MTDVARFDPWDSIRASTAYWRWSSRVWEIWATRSGGAAAIDAARRKRFADSGAVCPHALAGLSRRLSRAAGTGARPGRTADRDQAGVDGALRRLGHRSRAEAHGHRGVSRRPEAHRRALSRSLRRLEELGEHRHAGHLRAGCRRPGDVRRADGGASRAAALRHGASLGDAGRIRAGCAGGGDRRSLRQHRVVAARLPGEPVDRSARILDHGSAAAARRGPERLSARVSRELSDDARAPRRGAERGAAEDTAAATCGPAANAWHLRRRRKSSAPSDAASSTNTARRNA